MEIIKLLTDNEVVNFTDQELTFGRSVPLRLLENIIPTSIILQKIRTAEEVEFFIRSGYRDPQTNLQAGGSEKSLHMEFNAVDFCPSGYVKSDLEKLLSRIEEGEFNTTICFKGKVITVTPEHMGLGLSDSFIHMDTRGLLGRKSPERWRY